MIDHPLIVDEHRIARVASDDACREIIFPIERRLRHIPDAQRVPADVVANGIGFEQRRDAAGRQSIG